MIVVSGATGNVGSQVVGDLRRRGVPFRALVRDVVKARQKLGPDVELVAGDFGDPASLGRAVQGADVVFLCSATHVDQATHEANVIDAAVAAGAKRLVKISTVGAAAGSECAFLDRHGRAEAHLQRSGLGWTIVRGSGFYMTNVLLYAEMVRATGRLFVPAEGARIAMIDPRDVGAAAAVSLTEPGHEGRVYTLTGPVAISFGDVADGLSAALGRRIEFVPIDDDAAYRGMTGAGVPDVLARPLVILYRLLRGGMNATVTDTVRTLTGRGPRSFADFARDHAAAFAPEATTAR